MATVQIQGLRELQKLLRELPGTVERKILRGAARASAVVYRDAARSIVPIAKGDLRRSIKVGSTRAKGNRVQVNVTAGDKKAFYAHMVEYGTGRYYLGGKRRLTGAKRRRRTFDGSYVVSPTRKKALLIAGQLRAKAIVPGARPKPFMRVAFDTASQKALDVFKAYVTQRLAKELKL